MNRRRFLAVAGGSAAAALAVDASIVEPRGSGRYVHGWFRDAGQVPLYVSRGLGTSVAPVRFGARPEVAVFTMWV